MGNLNLYYDHMSTEGLLAFACNECHAYSMRDSIAAEPVPDGDVSAEGTSRIVPILGSSRPLVPLRYFSRTIPYSALYATYC